MDFPVILDTPSGEPLGAQLCQELRRAILGGRLAPGRRMPSTRSLAGLLDISRSTAVLCYDQLVSEGYLEATQGSGTFVCRHLPEAFLTVPRVLGLPAGGVAPFAQRLSSYGTRLLGTEAPAPQAVEARYRFSPSYPTLDAFPVAIWKKLLARHCQASAPALLEYAPESRGHGPLRTAIADYLGRARAVRCTPEQVIVLGSSIQALDLAARVWVEPGELVAMEDPGYPAARRAFLAHGARILPLAVGDGGLSLGALDSRTPCKLVYVTPSHQFPTGTAMPLAQRLELLAHCQQTGALLVEDDYDSEFRYGGRPLPAMQGLDQHGTVLYVGTFSKVLFPALRLGYLVAPPDLAEVLARAHHLANGQPPSLEQYALADFIGEGHLERHLRRMRTRYGRRRAELVAALERELGDRVTILGEASGMHLMVRFRTHLEDREVVRRAAGEGVVLVPAGPYYLDGRTRAGFILSFVSLDETRIRQGVRRLARVL